MESAGDELGETLKVNVDGAVGEASCHAFVGGLIRDCSGGWLLGFTWGKFQW